MTQLFLTNVLVYVVFWHVINCSLRKAYDRSIGSCDVTNYDVTRLRLLIDSGKSIMLVTLDRVVITAVTDVMTDDHYSRGNSNNNSNSNGAR